MNTTTAHTTDEGPDGHGRARALSLPGLPDPYQMPVILSPHRFVPSCAPNRSP